MEFIRFCASDGVELTGVLCDGGKENIILHIHGWCGNFYENDFVHYLCKELPKKGISFCAINTRAHDYRCDLKIKNGDTVSSATGGGAVDDFNSSLVDIDSAIQYLKRLGYKRVIVQGHSTAVQRVLNYALKTKYPYIILLSGGDIHSEITKGNSNSAKAFAEAEKLIKKGKGKEYLKESLWGVNFTAEALINGFGANVDSDLFPIRTGVCNPKLNSYTGNVLQIIGNDDCYVKIYSNAQTAVDFFNKSFVNAKQKTILLEDTHSFEKNPKKLVAEISKWCAKLN